MKYDICLTRNANDFFSAKIEFNLFQNRFYVHSIALSNSEQSLTRKHGAKIPMFVKHYSAEKMHMNF